MFYCPSSRWHLDSDDRFSVAMPDGFDAERHSSIYVRLASKDCADCVLSAWPFANAVKAGVSSVMCSYNRINGSYGCQNSKLLNGVLKDELNFQGYGELPRHRSKHNAS